MSLRAQSGTISDAGRLGGDRLGFGVNQAVGAAVRLTARPGLRDSEADGEGAKSGKVEPSTYCVIGCNQYYGETQISGNAFLPIRVDA